MSTMTALMGISAVDKRAEIAELASLVARTLPDSAGMDRMTGRRLEEFMTPVALTAHL